MKSSMTDAPNVSSSVSARFGIGFIAPFGRDLSRKYMLSGDVNMWRSIVTGRIARNAMNDTTWATHTHWCTVSSVLTALSRAYGREHWPRLAFLRGGSMNTVANAFGVPPGEPEVLLQRLLEGGARPVWPRATLEVEGRLGFLFTAGVLVGFLDGAKQERHQTARVACRYAMDGGDRFSADYG